jgi:ankyrin repeat protein
MLNYIKMSKLYIVILLISYASLHAQKNVFDACRTGTVEEISKLYNENPDIVNKVNDAGYTPLILACYHGNEPVVKFLIEKVKDINASSNYGTALMSAVVNGNISITKLLLDKNADVNFSDSNGTTALHYAVMFKNIELIMLLINAKADKTLKDNKQKSALDYAKIANDEKINTILNNK